MGRGMVWHVASRPMANDMAWQPAILWQGAFGALFYFLLSPVRPVYSVIEERSGPSSFVGSCLIK